MTAQDSGTAANQTQRAFTRIFFDAETVATQEVAGEPRFWPVELVDISLQGILIRILPDQHIDPDSPVEINIHLGGDVQICMETEVVNQRGDCLGLTCRHIDVDSMTHLRRLVELNIGDTSLLERELHALT